MMKTKYLYSFLLFMLPMITTAQVTVSPAQLAEKIQQFKQWRKPQKNSFNSLQRLKNARSIDDPIYREWSLNQQLKGISVSNLDTDTRLWLQSLTDYKSETKTWLKDGNYQIDVTVWKIAPQAKGILSRWEIAQAKQFALQKLADANWRELLTQSNKTQQQGYLQAIEQSSIEYLNALGKTLFQKEQRSNFEMQALWQIAKKTQNITWLKLLVSTADASFSTMLMKQYLSLNIFPAKDSVALLKAALGNPRLASFALLQLGEHVSNNPDIAALLFHYLDDKNLGGSAARALANSNDVSIEQQLKALSQSKNPLLKARAQQALNWQQQLEEKH